MKGRGPSGRFRCLNCPLTPIGACPTTLGKKKGLQIQPSLCSIHLQNKRRSSTDDSTPQQLGGPVATPDQPKQRFVLTIRPEIGTPTPSRSQPNSNQQSDLRAVFFGSLLASLGAILLPSHSRPQWPIQFGRVVLCLTGSLLGMFILFTGENGQRKASVGLSIGLALVVGVVGAFLAQVPQDAETNDSAQNDQAQSNKPNRPGGGISNPWRMTKTPAAKSQMLLKPTH